MCDYNMLDISSAQEWPNVDKSYFIRTKDAVNNLPIVDNSQYIRTNNDDSIFFNGLKYVLSYRKTIILGLIVVFFNK